MSRPLCSCTTFPPTRPRLGGKRHHSLTSHSRDISQWYKHLWNTASTPGHRCRPAYRDYMKYGCIPKCLEPHANSRASTTAQVSPTARHYKAVAPAISILRECRRGEGSGLAVSGEKHINTYSPQLAPDPSDWSARGRRTGTQAIVAHDHKATCWEFGG